VPAALLLMFALVYATLGRERDSLIVYAGIPFAVIGAVFALALRGMPFSITARSGSSHCRGSRCSMGVMIDQINALRETCDVDEAVRRGASDRLRPVLSIALVTSTLLTLLLLPNLYRWVEGRQAGRRGEKEQV
jgi:cobalt-zinc-cadmium resistance protein CzcA